MVMLNHTLCHTGSASPVPANADGGKFPRRAGLVAQGDRPHAQAAVVAMVMLNHTRCHTGISGHPEKHLRGVQVARGGSVAVQPDTEREICKHQWLSQLTALSF